MRLWTLHPKYLDARGLVALWREALLAQKVLRGATRGYKHHPQLIRFAETKNPPAALAAFLKAVRDEAEERGYTFDAEKNRPPEISRENQGDARPVALRMAALEAEVETTRSRAAARTGGGQNPRVTSAVQNHFRQGA